MFGDIASEPGYHGCMVRIRTSGGDGLAARLRSETAEDHRRAEAAPFVGDLLEGRLPVADYARLVVQHRAIYAALEAAVAANADPDLVPVLAPELTRLPAIEADLAFLLGADPTDWPEVVPAARTYADRITEVGGTSEGLVAHHYLRYLGDLSGGQMIGRALRRIYDFPDARGTAFYRFDAISSPKAFKDRYRSSLDALGWDEDRVRAVVDEVSLGFRLNADLFTELGAAASARPA